MKSAKFAIASQFNRHSGHYDAAADLQRQVADKLLNTHLPSDFIPRTILDLGAGTGYCAEMLAQRFPQSRVIALDIATNMLIHGRKQHSPHIHWCAGDFDYLPFAPKSMDLIVASMSLQWSLDLENTLVEIKRLLKPNGLLMFSLPGQDTLHELRACWREIDDRPHINEFHSSQALLTTLDLKFANHHLHAEDYKRAYPSLLSLFRELKSLGANYVVNHQRRGLGGKHLLQKLIEHYPCEPDRIIANFQIIYGKTMSFTS